MEPWKNCNLEGSNLANQILETEKKWRKKNKNGKSPCFFYSKSTENLKYSSSYYSGKNNQTFNLKILCSR